MKITQRLLMDLRIFCAVSKSYANNIRFHRAFREQNRATWWTDNVGWLLPIQSPENAHSEYYLHLSPSNMRTPDESDFWFCWLQDGQWGERFLHLRHLNDFEDLQEIVWALARLRAFENTHAMVEYAKTIDPEAHV